MSLLQKAVICILVAVSLAAPASATSRSTLQVTSDFRQNPAIERAEITYYNDDVRLAATLMMPTETPATASAILIQGSGRSDRTNVWAGMIAQLLVANGVAVVFPDKRASGDSGGDFRTSEFSDLADDAHAAVRHLRAHPELGAPIDTIGLVGLSQGGRVAPMVAARHTDEIAFVINISGGATDGLESLRHERLNAYREMAIEGVWLDRLKACDAIVDRLLLGEELLQQYLSCVAQFEGGPHAGLAARIYPTDPDDWRFNWFPQIVKVDPIPHWRGVRQPVFIALGANDEYENVPVARSVDLLEQAFADSGHTDHVIRVYPGVGHALWRRDGADVPVFDGAFVQDLSNWVRDRFRS